MIVGTNQLAMAQTINTLLDSAHIPLLLTGGSGFGKTHIAQHVAHEYADRHGVRAHYLQLSPDMSKTTLMMGFRLVSGSLVATDGIVSQAMQNGDILVVDEIGHATPQIMLLFNQLCDRDARLSIGELEVVAKPTFRVIFCANDSSYLGNSRLPQSFAQRLLCLNVGAPTVEDELAIITHMLTQGGFTVHSKVLHVLHLLMGYLRHHTGAVLSCRNVYSAYAYFSAVAPSKPSQLLHLSSGTGAKLLEYVKRPELEYYALDVAYMQVLLVEFSGGCPPAFLDAIKAGMLYYSDSHRTPQHAQDYRNFIDDMWRLS